MQCEEDWAVMQALYQGHGWSIARIAREFDVGWRTARRYATAATVPRYRPRARPVELTKAQAAHVIRRLGAHLELRATTLYREVRELGYVGSYPSFARRVRVLRPVDPQADPQVRFETGPGVQVQADWADCGQWLVGEQLCTLHALVAVLGLSRMVAVRFATDTTGPTTLWLLTECLNADGVASPTGKPVWGVSTLGRLLRNEAYVGRVYYNRTELVPTIGPGRRPTRQRPRARDEWVQIAVPAIVPDDVFEAAQRVSRDNAQWSPRRAEPGQWLLRGLLKCGTCGVGVNCHKMRGRNGTWHRYYYCRNHDPLRAGGEQRRCPERNIRSDALDGFVFDQVRQALLRPQVLLTGEHAVAVRAPAPDDQLLTAQLGRLDRKAEAAQAEHRRLVDCYQAGLIELVELQRRVKELDTRRRAITEQRHALADQRDALATDNRLRQRVGAFAERVLAALDDLDFPSASNCYAWWSRRSGSPAGRRDPPAHPPRRRSPRQPATHPLPSRAQPPKAGVKQ